MARGWINVDPACDLWDAPRAHHPSDVPRGEGAGLKGEIGGCSSVHEVLALKGPESDIIRCSYLPALDGGGLGVPITLLLLLVIKDKRCLTPEIKCGESPGAFSCFRLFVDLKVPAEGVVTAPLLLGTCLLH